MSGMVWNHTVSCDEVEVWLHNPDPYTISWVEYWGDLTGQPSTANLAPGADTPHFKFPLKGTKTFNFGANALYPNPVGRRDPGAYSFTATKGTCEVTTTTESVTTTTVAPTTTVVISTTVQGTTTTTTIQVPTSEIASTTRPTITGSIVASQPTLPRTGKSEASTAVGAGGLVLAGILCVALTKRGRHGEA